MNDALPRTGVRLTNGRESMLTSDDVRRAAATLSTSESTRARVIVDGRELSPVDVAAVALGVPSDLLNLDGVITALRSLKFRVEGGRDVDIPRDPPWPVPRTQRVLEGMTAEQSVKLRRYRGEWVALRDGRVLAHASKLATVVAHVGGEEATYVRIPTTSEAKAP